MKRILILILFITMIHPVLGINRSIDQDRGKIYGNQPTSYTTFVDHIYGFYKVYESSDNGTISKPVNYKDRTLYINKGDTVFWSNDAVPDTDLTILSDKKLWINTTCGNYLCSDLRWNYKKFGYTFNQSGTYKIYIKQFPTFIQKIIVGPSELSQVGTTKTLGVNNSINYTENIVNTVQPIPTSTANKNLNKKNTSSTTESGTYNFSFSISNIMPQLSRRLDTFVLILVLLIMVILSGKIKDEEKEEIEIENQ